jgi:hypothetical protein
VGTNQLENNSEDILEKLCVTHLLNAVERSQECSRMHDFSVDKNIKRIFYLLSERINKGIVIYNPSGYRTEEPIYVFYQQNRLSFNKLSTPDRYFENRNVISTEMMLERVNNQDLILPE